MIDEVIIEPGKKAELPVRVRSLLHLGAGGQFAAAGPVLLRDDEKPNLGVPIYPGSGMYWPNPSTNIEIEIENPAGYSRARIIYSDEIDLTRKREFPQSALLLRNSWHPGAVHVLTELQRVSLNPAQTLNPFDDDSERQFDAHEVHFFSPSEIVRPLWARSTVVVQNWDLANVLNISLYGVSSGPRTLAQAKLIGTVAVAANSEDVLDVAVRGWPIIILTYTQAAGDVFFAAIWEVHTG